MAPPRTRLRVGRENTYCCPSWGHWSGRGSDCSGWPLFRYLAIEEYDGYVGVLWRQTNSSIDHAR